MVSRARILSYKLLRQIDLQYVFSDDALNCEEMNSLDIRDRHLTTEIVYGTLRWQGLLDYVLAKSSSRPWQEVAPAARILLRMSVYQMWHMNRIPDHALVNDAVELAKSKLGKGIDRYINGILRNLSRTRPWQKKDNLRDVPPWAAVSLPKWLWDRWEKRYGKDMAESYALSLNVPPQHALRVVTQTGLPENLPFEVIRSDIVPDAYIRTESKPENAVGNNDPVPFQYQDEASQLIPHLLADDAGYRRIWDACAAPGGKSAFLGKICGEKGTLVASDLVPERVLRMVAAMKTSGISRIDAIIADASKPAPFRQCFDAVLADVPCSGLGTLRRNPEIKWHFETDRFVSLQKIQKQIIHNVSDVVCVGGRLLYSTCSTEPEENEYVVESFLSTHPGFRLEKPACPPGILKYVCPDRMIRTFPGTRLWDGFFAALLVRYN